MKWVFLLLMLLLTPILVSQLRSNGKKWFGIAGFLLGIGPFILGPLHLAVAPYSWPAWQGTVKGFDVSLIDFVALALFLSTRPTQISSGVKLSAAIVLTAFVISAIGADDPMPCLFYGWQFARAALVFLAVARSTAAVANFPFSVLTGYAAGIAYLAVTVVIEFGQGDIQAGGIFGHQNFTGLVTMFIVFPAFALLIAGKRIKTALLILAAEAVIAFAGGSRATIGLLGAGLVLTLILSMWHQRSARKTTAAAALAIVMAIAAPVMILAIERRPEAARAGSSDERRKFEDAAGMIVNDHPLGVGANRYVITANLGGYSDRAGVPWNYTERSAPVHNAYYLIAAEMGVLGLFGYIALLGSFILVGLRGVKFAGSGTSSDLLVGLAASSIVTAVFFAFEWITMTSFIHYFAAMNGGMIVGLAFALANRSSTPELTKTIRRGPGVEAVTAPA